ncbi:MAG: pyridine nucleotide-disulfide oxidoreductase [Rhodobacterales bacterium]|nr:MAG: pyridine nucleotide-disulfide oxidoreductase [Rhodobacterales bacterium]
MTHIVIVGAGQAAASCCAKLRAEGHDGPITLIGAEPVPPYQRPPLSKAYLLGDLARERLFLRPEAWYDENDITLRTGTRVTGLRADLKQIELEAREMLSYDHLVLATGAHPRALPAEIGGDLDGVFLVRDLADADAMAPAFEGGHLLVVGGGYIGLEAAAVARKRGMDVTLIEAAPRILGRVACAETADAVRALHQSHGVTIREGVGLTRLIGEDRVTGAELSDGATLEVTAVVAGIGVTPATILAEAAGLTIDNGIAVDEQGRASAEGVWAIGDCANFPHAGGRMRLESVGNAIDMGELVARNILGAGQAYTPHPWFWSDQYDDKLQIAGLGTGADRVVVRQADGLSHWYYREGQLIAVDALNDPRAYMVGKRLIEGGASPAPEAVANPSTALKSLL